MTGKLIGICQPCGVTYILRSVSGNPCNSTKPSWCSGVLACAVVTSCFDMAFLRMVVAGYLVCVLILDAFTSCFASSICFRSPASVLSITLCFFLYASLAAVYPFVLFYTLAWVSRFNSGGLVVFLRRRGASCVDFVCLGWSLPLWFLIYIGVRFVRFRVL